MPSVLLLTGGLDRTALVAALQELIDRHEPLRTVFVSQRRARTDREVPAAGSAELFRARAAEAPDVEPDFARGMQPLLTGRITEIEVDWGRTKLSAVDW
ncbi:hypothetical protein [Streptomyces sp. 891-h]|uniref:hypothetical protein n=1 Tax=unclassified Streptomyces TaxID=2593676 RepID=UPI001FAAF8B0|nr:hypothetical protein [Streptomyces sp. 891-h]UNZ21004.1 hypothetical protein HC362_31900 [Streptomyces sp. 891-h]